MCEKQLNAFGECAQSDCKRERGLREEKLETNIYSFHRTGGHEINTINKRCTFRITDNHFSGAHETTNIIVSQEQLHAPRHVLIEPTAKWTESKLSARWLCTCLMSEREGEWATGDAFLLPVCCANKFRCEKFVSMETGARIDFCLLLQFTAFDALCPCPGPDRLKQHHLSQFPFGKIYISCAAYCCTMHFI